MHVECVLLCSLIKRGPRRGGNAVKSLEDLWVQMKGILSQIMSETSVNTWFDEVSIIALEDMAVVLYCPNEFKRDVIQKRFMDRLEGVANEVFDWPIGVKILSEEQLSAYHGVRPDHPVGQDRERYFTFETFVSGPQSQMAYAAARFVAEQPAKQYNPLFIYGNSGLGKTHLLYAIRHETLSRYPNFNIAYVKGDEFINEFIELIRAGRGDEFRSKYRVADMLLVDDIQFVAGKEQVQNEFFHTFNTLYEAGKQIVLTSDVKPNEMALLDDRLRTRFAWGLMADIAPPDYETRMAIIRNKERMLGLNLCDKGRDRVANNFTGNVRQIEGILNKLRATQDLLHAELDEETQLRVIDENIQQFNDYLTPEYIIKTVADFFSLDSDLIRSQDRRKDVTNARQIAMYLMRRMVSNMSLKEIGKYFDNRDHSTVLSSLSRVENQLRTDKAFAETVKQITSNVNARK